MKPRISRRGRNLLRSTSASKALMKALLESEMDFSHGKKVSFTFVSGETTMYANVVKTTTLSNSTMFHK